MSNLPKETYSELLRESSREYWNELYVNSFEQFQAAVMAIFEGVPRWGEAAQFATPAAREAAHDIFFGVGAAVDLALGVAEDGQLDSKDIYATAGSTAAIGLTTEALGAFATALGTLAIEASSPELALLLGGIADLVIASTPAWIPLFGGFIATVIAGVAGSVYARAVGAAFEEYQAQNEPNIWNVSVDNPAINEPVSIRSLSSYFLDIIGDGVEGRHDGIKASITGLQSGHLYKDLNLLQNEVLQLTDFNDYLDTRAIDLSAYDSWRFLDDQYIIDMRGGIEFQGQYTYLIHSL
jgi:hypothetical protein